jgi:hypothetical protein
VNTATVDVVVLSVLMFVIQLMHYSVDGQTCHVIVGTIPDDHFDVDENPDKEVG